MPIFPLIPVLISILTNCLYMDKLSTSFFNDVNEQVLFAGFCTILLVNNLYLLSIFNEILPAGDFCII